MSFQQSTNFDCGQSNHLLKLSSHLIRDHAGQEILRHPSTSMCVDPFQSFDMHELMNVKNNVIQFRRDLASSNGEMWTKECKEEDSVFEQIWMETNLQNPNVMQNFSNAPWRSRTVSPFPFKTRYFPQPPPNIGYIISNERTSGIDAWECQQKELLKNQDNAEYAIVESLQDLENVQEQNQSLGDQRKQLKNYLSWEGITVEDVNGILQEGHVFNNAIMFNEFLKAFTVEYCEITNKHHPSLCQKTPKSSLIEKEYEFQENNPVLNTEIDNSMQFLRAVRLGDYFEAILHLEAILQKNPASVIHWNKLGVMLDIIKQKEKAITAFKSALKCQPDNLPNLLLLFEEYIQIKKPYQACQWLVKWLKCHHEYGDILPPDFELENKETDKVDKETLDFIKKMFIKAARRKPNDPDEKIQYILSILFSLSRDYDKVIDCQLILLSLENCTPSSYRDNSILMSLATNLFFADRIEKALEIFHRQFAAAKSVEQIINANNKLGIVYMYLKQYKKASYYLLEALHVWREASDYDIDQEEISAMQARLHLCTVILASKINGDKVIDNDLLFDCIEVVRECPGETKTFYYV